MKNSILILALLASVNALANEDDLTSSHDGYGNVRYSDGTTSSDDGYGNVKYSTGMTRSDDGFGNYHYGNVPDDDAGALQLYDNGCVRVYDDYNC